METSLSVKELSLYVRKQINKNFPDTSFISYDDIYKYVNLALERLEFCLSKTAMERYKKNNLPYFNHLFSDTYMLFLCYLANTIWNETHDKNLSSKVYYLNKVMHSFDCMYDNKIPDVFLIIHGFGSMMGKAHYGNYFVIYQGCTIGANHGLYPNIGNGVTVTANVSVIGKCKIGNRSTISTRTTLFQKDVPNDSIAYLDFELGKLLIKGTEKCYAQQFFNVDLNKI